MIKSQELIDEGRRQRLVGGMTNPEIIQWAEEKAKGLFPGALYFGIPSEEELLKLRTTATAALVEAYEVGDRAGMERACALVCHDCSRNFFPAVFKNGRWVHPSEHIDWSCKASAIRAAMEEGEP